MELVLLADLQSSYAQNWIRVANTSGLRSVRIGDRFREQGFGSGAEELQVDGLGISDVGGLSRLFVIRAANATQPEVHRLGAVFELVGSGVPPSVHLQSPENGSAQGSTTIRSVGDLLEGWPEAAGVAVAERLIEELVTPRRRGRPLGSKNKPRLKK